jgi:general transcription factor 3C polypeptide 5 (transcription factor C subunit 1)
MTPHKSPPKASPNLPNAPHGLQQLVKYLKIAFYERPVWTRRALANHVGGRPHLWLLKPARQFVTYQFKGSPFREVAIKLGIDPRTDPKYRTYQTMFFKLHVEEKDPSGMNGLACCCAVHKNHAID